ncbi:hypothetical protein [Stenotrophomonas sp. 24(2023)]|uniref:hypothetical protein n=1 Tax=Stenotrophomonas sp. 24(2023) TaxID=3068324 RepID=UPI0027E1435F|nr:hypothetical protein [Stenotrophomonas sp. 24(2023)]WMJ68439.1 hypothetical protein Q9R17_14720 [Stenotrophomonas sp. 24(2023)]
MDVVTLTETRDGYDIDTTGWGAHVARIEAGLPAAIRAFVAAPWRYDVQDPRCLHDAWLQELVVKEAPRGQARGTEVLLVLEGAWGGRFELRYRQVTRFLLDKADGPDEGLGDLLVEELVPREENRFRHELAFVGGTLLLEFSGFSETRIDVPAGGEVGT